MDETRICDRCGKELEARKSFHVETSVLLEHDSWDEPEYRRREGLDPDIRLCGDCIKDIEDFVRDSKGFTRRSLGRYYKPQQDKLDMGKVMALRTAKPPWSLAKIADEMGVSLGTIRTAIMRYEAENGGQR